MSNQMYTEEFKIEAVKQISERSLDPLPNGRRQIAVVAAVTASAAR